MTRALGLAVTLFAASCGRTSGARAPAPLPGPAPVPALASDAAGVRHLLGRLTFGPRPGEVERVQAMGVGAWLDQQLAPDRLPDPAGQLALAPHAVAELSPVEVWQRYAKKGPMTAADPMSERQYAEEVQMSALARHIASERGVLEVMTDFWTNYFNVFARKANTRWFVADFVEHAIRPNALGHFEDLLIATARHPAMLIYLDNARSVAAGTPARNPKAPRGINENYARELLELHTLGVDGGYTQTDVSEVARVLTGWSVSGPNPADGMADPFAFRFRGRAHDRGEKVVLGHRFPSGAGEDEGFQLLRLLANHPATAHHVARRLCQRLVADDPPAGCVDAGARAFLATRGDLAEVVRAIVLGPDFWAARGSKVKSPLELVTSALRVLGAVPGEGVELTRTLALLGQDLFMNPVPTGYASTASTWLSTGPMLGRMNLAVALAGERLPGAQVDLAGVVPIDADPDRLVARVDQAILGGTASPHTLAVMREQAAHAENPRQARAIAVALALGSPEFQVR